MTYLSFPPRALLGGAIALALIPSAQAESSGFFEDSKTSLTLRNYYFNRDFNDPGASKSKIEEWAQGAILKFSSGFTPGVVGFGLDGIAMFGVKLDSGPQRSDRSCCRCTTMVTPPTTTGARGWRQKCVCPTPS